MTRKKKRIKRKKQCSDQRFLLQGALFEEVFFILGDPYFSMQVGEICKVQKQIMYQGTQHQSSYIVYDRPYSELYIFQEPLDYTMAIPVVEFSRKGCKIRNVFGKKINCRQIKITKFGGFEFLLSNCQKVSKFHFQNQFATYVKNHPNFLN